MMETKTKTRDEYPMQGKVLNLLSLGRQSTSTGSFTRKKLLKERLRIELYFPDDYWA